MNTCMRCIELENYFDRQIFMLKHELKKRDESIQIHEDEIIRLRQLIKWYTEHYNTSLINQT